MSGENVRHASSLAAVSPKQTRPRIVVVNFRVPEDVKARARAGRARRDQPHRRAARVHDRVGHRGVAAPPASVAPPTVSVIPELATDQKHDACDPCPCGSGDEHYKHAHQPWFGLTGNETAILDFEALAWSYAGAKEQAVLERFGVSMVRYWHIVNALIDRPEALAYSPLVVRQLQHIRDARVAARAAR